MYYIYNNFRSCFVLISCEAHFLSPKAESRRVVSDTRRCACSIACAHRPKWQTAGTWTRCSKCAPVIVALPSGFRRPGPGLRSCCRLEVRPTGSTGPGVRMVGSSWRSLIALLDSSCRAIRSTRRWSSDGT